MRLKIALLCALAIFWHTPLLNAAEVIRGPILARIVKVIDGDSFHAEVLVWPQVKVGVNVRIHGMDAPEMRGKCAVEKAAAAEAKQALKKLLGGGLVYLERVSLAKYAGRVVSVVKTKAGVDVAAAMISGGHGRKYLGGKRKGWC